MASNIVAKNPNSEPQNNVIPWGTIRSNSTITPQELSMLHRIAGSLEEIARNGDGEYSCTLQVLHRLSADLLEQIMARSRN